jgi:signal peptidase I
VIREKTAAKAKRPFWLELPALLLVAVVVALLFRTFVVQTFYIPSGSMENTLLVNDRVLVNKLVYDVRDPRRGEVVVFVSPLSWRSNTSETDFIKRVVGLPGDTVACCDPQGRVTVNGQPLDEKSYLYPNNVPSLRTFSVVVPKGRLFVLGDHREVSGDSREHLGENHGTISEDSVVGRAFIVFWPVNRISFLPVPDTFSRIPDPAEN